MKTATKVKKVPVTKFQKDVEDATGVTAERERAAKAEEHFEAKVAPSDDVREIPLSELFESPTNPRRTFNEAALRELAESLNSVGLMTPLTVREGSTKKGYEIVAGARRFRAAKLAGWKSVLCDVRALTDVQLSTMRMVENCQRLDLSPMEEAEGFEELQRVSGYTVPQLAAKVGKKASHVYARLKLCALGAEGRKALADEKLQATVAVLVARIPSQEIQAKTLKVLLDAERPLNVRDQISYIHEHVCRALKGAPFDQKDETLDPDAGSCAKCKKNSLSATPGLFDDLAGQGGAWCTDAKCYEGKAKATWDEKASKMREMGAKVLSMAEGRSLFRYGDNLTFGSKYVEARTIAPQDKKKRSWKQLAEELLESERPQLFVAPRDSKPVELYLRDDLLKALTEKLGLKWAENLVEEQRAAPGPQGTDEYDTRRNEEKTRSAVATRCLVHVAQAVAAKGLDLNVARIAAEELADFPGSLYLDALGVKEPLKWLAEDATLAQYAALLVVHAVGHDVLGVFGGYSDVLLRLATETGFDVEAATKAVGVSPPEEMKSEDANDEGNTP